VVLKKHESGIAVHVYLHIAPASGTLQYAGQQNKTVLAIQKASGCLLFVMDSSENETFLMFQVEAGVYKISWELK
jgi:hypothetical protein